MRRIYLLRHAKSSWGEAGLADFDRALNSRGRKAARLMARHLAEAGLRPAEILCSAAKRTQETLAQIEPLLEGVPASIEEGLYLASRHDLMARLRKLDDHLDSVMVIGHNPGIEKLADSLCDGHGEQGAVTLLKTKYPTCTLAVLDSPIKHWAELQAGTCRLAAFVRPKDLGGDDDE
ncbi:Phosphoglycerate mutase family protein [Magnetospirillum sp. LM-5]|uniref:SixA phosphatase family protein n=1 Tax=Magnetospirillum sp. LM-5 TaxID=2681466 RepID=UPI00137F950D|nr:histidine phosphatase family protein [Magnetospirillum sp. LM-5]CAA7621875.1 Phosphoglycerate mutase family protein [Magnetospirillum sp. LM-5]